MFSINFIDYDIRHADIKFNKFLINHLFSHEDNKFKKRIKNYGFEIQNDIYYNFIVEFKNTNECIFYYELNDENDKFSILQSFEFFYQMIVKKFIIEQKNFYISDLELFNTINKGEVYLLNSNWKLIDVDVMKSEVILINKISHIKMYLHLQKMYLEYFYYYFGEISQFRIQYTDNIIKIIR